MSATELAIRVAACSQLCLLALLLWRDRKTNRSYRFAVPLALGIACYLLAPLVTREWQWGAAAHPVIVLAMVVPALFWYFANAVFDDEFNPPPRTFWLLVATALLGYAAYCTSADSGPIFRPRHQPLPGWIVQAAKLLWIAAALATVLKDWQADLVEPRRRLRLLIVVVGGCYMVAIIVVELWLRHRVTAAVELFNVSALLLAVTALCLHILGTNSTNVLIRMTKPAAPALPAPSPLAAQVLALMEQQRAYAEDAVTIATLAAALRTQPHKLRQVINGELGYRNFNSFINLYRIREVAQRLEEAKYRDTPLLTLALDAGFRSLAPFNRSFKEHFGTTPSDYRQRLAKTD